MSTVHHSRAVSCTRIGCTALWLEYAATNAYMLRTYAGNQQPHSAYQNLCLVCIPSAQISVHAGSKPVPAWS